MVRYILRVIHSIRDLDIRQLVNVCRESLEISGKENYPQISANLQILYAEQDFCAYVRDFLSDSASVYAVWDAEGGYKAVLRLEPYLDGLLLSGLETLPEDRCRGYGKKLMNAVLEYVSDAAVYSHVSKSNEASLGVHRACGFQRIQEFANYIDGSVLSSACTLVYRR